MGWGERNKPKPTVLGQQEATREALRTAVAGWAVRLGATDTEYTIVMTAPNRDGRPLAIQITIVTTGLDT